MSVLTGEASRTDLLNRLKRPEGQLRGIRRLLEEGQECTDIATQVAAVRKALHSTYVRMTVCFLHQELQSHSREAAGGERQLQSVLEDVQTLLNKIR
ncbi:MAG: metal-sensing transcriptional repressor [Rubrivivax sp.]|nr:metal-sensing transcriptional repressor [Rubrivivax sp.]